MKVTQKTKEIGTMNASLECAGIHELLDWQIIQHRQSVDEYRRELSHEQHRCVSWQEAEQEYSKMGLKDMGEQSRIEYCGLVCPERNKCLLSQFFLSAHDDRPMCKAG